MTYSGDAFYFFFPLSFVEQLRFHHDFFGGFLKFLPFTLPHFVLVKVEALQKQIIYLVSKLKTLCETANLSMTECHENHAQIKSNLYTVE